MNISPVSMVNSNYNTVKTHKQPSFKGFGGISEACRLHFSNEELKVLYNDPLLDCTPIRIYLKHIFGDKK